MNMRTRIHNHGATATVPVQPAYHVESLPNVSAIFSVSVLADRDDILAAVRTGALLAGSSHASFAVTVLDESVLYTEPGKLTSGEALEQVLNSVRTKLFMQRSTNRVDRFALEANITSASFLTAGAITLQVRLVDSLPQNPSSSR